MGDEGRRTAGSSGEDVDGMIRLDKELVFVVKLHEVLVSNFDISPVSIGIRKDPDFGFLASEFVLEYDLGYGDSLTMTCKREGGSVLISLASNDKEMNYSVPLDLYVDDDFMPVVDEEFAKLVEDWFE